MNLLAHPRLLLGVVPLLFMPLLATAHDPYEITSTVRIESNRTELEFEMEFNGAMLMVGAANPREAGDAATLFQAKLPELSAQAASFFQLSAGEDPMVPTATNVVLGVEDHVNFKLEFPPVAGGLRLSAPGLKALGEHGPFGTTMTVLDLVNNKVLAQPVLFADSPEQVITPAQPDAMTAVQPIASGASSAVPTTREHGPEGSVNRPGGRNLGWSLGVLIFFAVVLLLLLRQWQRSGGRQ